MFYQSDGGALEGRLGGGKVFLGKYAMKSRRRQQVLVLVTVRRRFPLSEGSSSHRGLDLGAAFWEKELISPG